MKFNKLLSLVFLALLINCSEDKPRNNYDMAVERYLNEVVYENSATAASDTDLLILPLNGCNSCLLEVLEYVKTIKKKNLNLLLVGESNDPDIISLAQDLSQNYLTMTDPQNRLIQYRTNIAEPALLQMSEEGIHTTHLTLSNYTNHLKP